MLGFRKPLRRWIDSALDPRGSVRLPVEVLPASVFIVLHIPTDAPGLLPAILGAVQQFERQMREAETIARKRQLLLREGKGVIAKAPIQKQA